MPLSNEDIQKGFAFLHTLNQFTECSEGVISWADALVKDGMRAEPNSAFQQGKREVFYNPQPNLSMDETSLNAKQIERLLSRMALFYSLVTLRGEVQELMSEFRAYVLYGSDASDAEFDVEFGDVTWAIGQIAKARRPDDPEGYLNEIVAQNLEKLKDRYPNGFQYHRAQRKKD